MNKIDVEAARARLNYNPETGILTWKSTGKRAGGIHIKGYRVIRIDRILIKEHRIAYAIFHEHDVPDGMQIDHVNRDKSDNRISNLRLATNAQNQFNKGLRSTNTSGFKGVCMKGGKYTASIKKNAKTQHLGTFETPEEAHKAYMAAATQHEPDFAFSGS